MSSKKKCVGAGDQVVSSNSGAANGLLANDENTRRRVSGRRERQQLSRTTRDIYRRPTRGHGTRHLLNDGRRSGRKGAPGSGEGSGCFPPLVESFHSVPNVALVSAHSLDTDDASRQHRRHRRRRHTTRRSHAVLEGDLASLGSRTSRFASAAGAGDLVKERQGSKLVQIAPGFTIEVSVDMPWSKSNPNSASSRTTTVFPSNAITHTSNAATLALPGATGDSRTNPALETRTKISTSKEHDDNPKHSSEVKVNDYEEKAEEMRSGNPLKGEPQIKEDNDGNNFKNMIDSLLNALMTVNMPSGVNQIQNQVSPQECFVVLPQFSTDPQPSVNEHRLQSKSKRHSGPRSPPTAGIATGPSGSPDATPGPPPSSVATTPSSPPTNPQAALPPQPFPPPQSLIYPSVPPQGYPFHIPGLTPPIPFPSPYGMYPPIPSLWNSPYPQDWPQSCPLMAGPPMQQEQGSNKSGANSSAGSTKNPKSHGQFASVPYGYPPWFPPGFTGITGDQSVSDRSVSGSSSTNTSKVESSVLPPAAATNFCTDAFLNQHAPHLGPYSSVYPLHTTPFNSAVPGFGGYPYPAFPGMSAMPMGYGPLPYQLPQSSVPYPMEPGVAEAVAFGWAPGSVPSTAAAVGVTAAAAAESERVAAQVIRESPGAKRRRRWRQRRRGSLSPRRAEIPRVSPRHSASASRLCRMSEHSSSIAFPSPIELLSPRARWEGPRRRQPSSSSEQSSDPQRTTSSSSSSESGRSPPPRRVNYRPRKAPLPPELASAWKLLEVSSSSDTSSSSSSSLSESDVHVNLGGQCPFGRWIQPSRYATTNPGLAPDTITGESGERFPRGFIPIYPNNPKIKTLPGTDNNIISASSLRKNREETDGDWEDIYFGKRRKLNCDDREQMEARGEDDEKTFQFKEFRFFEKDFYSAWHHGKAQPALKIDEESEGEISQSNTKKCVEYEGCDDNDGHDKENSPQTSSSRSSQCIRPSYTPDSPGIGQKRKAPMPESDKETNDDDPESDKKLSHLQGDTISSTKIRVAKNIKSDVNPKPDCFCPIGQWQKKKYEAGDSKGVFVRTMGSKGTSRSSSGERQKFSPNYLQMINHISPDGSERSPESHSLNDDRSKSSSSVGQRESSETRRRVRTSSVSKDRKSEDGGIADSCCSICGTFTPSTSTDTLRCMRVEPSIAARFISTKEGSSSDEDPLEMDRRNAMTLTPQNLEHLKEVQGRGNTEHVLYADHQPDLSDLEGKKKKFGRTDKSEREHNEKMSDPFLEKETRSEMYGNDRSLPGSAKHSAGVSSVSITKKEKRNKKGKGRKKKPLVSTKPKKKMGIKTTKIRLGSRKKCGGYCIGDPLHISMVRYGQVGATPFRGLGPPKHKYLYKNWICDCCRARLRLSKCGTFPQLPFKAQRLPRWLRARIARRARELEKRFYEAQEYREEELCLSDPYGAYYNQGYNTCDQTKLIPCHINKKYPKHGPCMNYKGFKRRHGCLCGHDLSSEDSTTSSESRCAIRAVMKKLRKRYTGQNLFQKAYRSGHSHESSISHPVSYTIAMTPCSLAPSGTEKHSKVRASKKSPSEGAGKISNLIAVPFDGLQHDPCVLPFEFKSAEPCYIAGKMCAYCHCPSHAIPTTPIDQPHEIQVLNISAQIKKAASISMLTSGTPYHVRCSCCNKPYFNACRTRSCWLP